MRTFSTLFRNIAANTTTTGLIAGYQVLSVPVFLHFWGPQLFGEWITLNAITAYFQISDIGLNTATANSVTFSHANNDYHRCNVLLNNNIIFVFATFALLSLLLVVLIQLDVLADLFRFEVMSTEAMKVGLMLLFAQIFVGTLNNLLTAVFRATDNFARGVMIDNAIRFSEYSVLLLGVATGLSLPVILLLGLAVKLVGLVIKYRDSRRVYKFPVGVSYFSYTELKRMLVPAVSFFLFPLANSIAFQGPVVLLNFFMGSVEVVVFSTTRTLVNFVRSIIDILQRSVWPPMSLAYGRNDAASLKRLHRGTVVSSLAVVIGMSAFLLVVGEQVYTLWTRRQADYDSTLFVLFLLTLVAGTLWSSSAVVLQATNNHVRLAILSLGTAVSSLGLSYVVLRYLNDMSYLPLALLVGELVIVAYVLKRSLSLTGDSLAIIRAELRAAVRARVRAFGRS